MRLITPATGVPAVRQKAAAVAALAAALAAVPAAVVVRWAAAQVAVLAEGR